MERPPAVVPLVQLVQCFTLDICSQKACKKKIQYPETFPRLTPFANQGFRKQVHSMNIEGEPLYNSSGIQSRESSSYCKFCSTVPLDGLA